VQRPNTVLVLWLFSAGRLDQPRETKVGELDYAVGCEKKVGWFDVAMEYSHGVAVGYSG